ncbi:uncharacterized protein LOC123516756 [Portunus trituberculatus]|uniref:uncharacterized protein LOC123514690 n=1 Tax=Portunus trituberculatus TaxID=210409 RepID=UPI001E1CF6F6|nr:uncharacterized protein LOC123514690 [Portunus trituberculatus]XP_045132319.1 uncharacterized protein LOC123516756 [Portunus trituberculatus]
MADEAEATTSTESYAWKYFEKLKCEESSRCRKCLAVIKCRGWSTSGMIRHLKSKHSIEKTENLKRPSDKSPHKDASEVKRSSVQRKMTGFLKKEETKEEIVGKLAAVDGFSINAIAKSEFIKTSMLARGYKLPQSPTLVMDLVHKQYNVAKERVIFDINKRRHVGVRFGLSLDEYTSLKNKRYMNINLHTSDTFWNLGMVRITGSLPAETAVEVVENKLADFQVNLERDVVACVTDGASVMVKFGKLIKTCHHMCYAHGIHLAVCDVLYKKTNDNLVSLERRNVTYLQEEEADDVEAVQEEEEFSGMIEVVSDEDLENIRLEDLEDDEEGNIDLSVTINKVRKIVKMFRKSPTRNEKLQRYVVSEYGKELMLKLDSKTRWNSLLDMLERFLKVKNSVAKAMIDCNMEMNITNGELKVLNDLVTALQPVKLGAERMGCRGTTILTAEGVFSFMLKELNEQQSSFSMKLQNSLNNRINERRSAVLVGLMKYLHCGKAYNNCEERLALPRKSAIVESAKQLLGRLFQVSDEETTTSDNVETSVNQQNSLTDKLQAAIDQIQTQSKKRNECNYIAKEFSVFEATGDRTQNLEKLFQALNSVPPTSVESERAFSAAGLFITKLRSKLSDHSIDCLCFLKSYFKNNS